MSAESRTEAAWKGFFLATIAVALIRHERSASSFIIGSLADTAIFAITGNDNFLYGYVLAKAGTFVGIAVGMTVGIRTGLSTAIGAGQQRQQEQPRQPIG